VVDVTSVTGLTVATSSIGYNRAILNRAVLVGYFAVVETRYELATAYK
jgi:hypothetical protein